MSKDIFDDDSIKDLKCYLNHENSPVILIQLQPDDQNKLLCVQCLEKFTSNFQIITIQNAIAQIKKQQEDKQKNIESQIEQRVELFEQFQIQIDKMKELIDQLLSSLSQNIIEWRNQLKNIMKENIEVSLQYRLEKFNQEIDQKDVLTCQNNICQIDYQFSQLIEKDIGLLKETIIYFHLNYIFQDNKNDLELFPKSKQLLYNINYSDTIKQMRFNYDNSLIFLLADYNFESVNLLTQQIETIESGQYHYQNIVASKKENTVVVYNSDSVLEIYYLRENKKWNCEILKINLGRLQFMGMDQDEGQIILQCSDLLSIVQIDKESKQLIYLNSIPLLATLNSLRMVESSSLLVATQNKNILLIKQNNLKEWTQFEKIPLPLDYQGIDAFQIDKNNILVICNHKNQKFCLLYIENQLIQVEKQFVLQNFGTNFIIGFNPNLYNKAKKLYLQKSDESHYLIKQTKDNKFQAWSQVICTIGSNCLIEWSDDGKLLALWDIKLRKIRIHELIY